MEQGQNRAIVKGSVDSCKDLDSSSSLTMRQIHTQVASIHPRDLKLCRSCGQLCFYLGHMSPHHAVDSRTGFNIDSMPIDTKPNEKVKKCSVTLGLEKEMKHASPQTMVLHVGETVGKCFTGIPAPTTPEPGNKCKRHVFNAEERVTHVSKTSVTATDASQVSVQKPRRVLRTRAPSQESVSPLRRQSRTSSRSSGVRVAPSSGRSSNSQESVNLVKPRVQQNENKGKTKDGFPAPSAENFLHVNLNAARPSHSPKSKVSAHAHRSPQSDGKTYNRTRKEHGSPTSASEEDFQRHMRSMSKTTSSSSEESLRTVIGARKPSPRAIGKSHQSPVNHSTVAETVHKNPPLAGSMHSNPKDVQRAIGKSHHSPVNHSAVGETVHKNPPLAGSMNSTFKDVPRDIGKSHQSPVNHSAGAETVHKKPPLTGSMSSTAKDVHQKRKIVLRDPNVSRRGRSTPAHARPRKSSELYILEDGVSKMQRKPCDICQRWFDVNRVDAHMQICQRLAEVDAEKKAKSKKFRKRSVGSMKKGDKGKPLSKIIAAEKGKDSDWRRKHEDFINTIRSAKLLSAHLAAGGKASDLPPPPPSDTSDYLQCPHCSRKFCAKSAERHIKFCETQRKSGGLAVPRAMSVHRK